MEYFFSIGTNIGDKKNNLKKSIEYLKQQMDIISISSIYETDPIGMKPGTDNFLNMVIEAKSSINPFEMLDLTQKIEKKIGRTKKGKGKDGIYNSRIIDIDILLAGKEIIDTEKLTIPHKEMTNRAFVLIPLIEIDPDIYHPLFKKPITSYLRLIKDDNKVVKIR